MKEVRIKEHSLIAKLAAKKLGTGNVAIVIGHTIHLWNATAAQLLNNKKWLLHELKHVEQYERYGKLKFVASYLYESITKGYRNNKFEVEARAAINDLQLRDKYKIVLP